MKKVFFLCVTFLFLQSVLAQSVSTMPSSTVKGLYIDKFYDILGNIAKENTLLTYAQAKGFNYLALYDLHRFDFTNPIHQAHLAAFIKKAKTEFGIQQIGAIGENIAFFRDRIIGQYQASRIDSLEKFDVLNLEFEYWTSPLTNTGKYYCDTYLQSNGLTCDRKGAFAFYLRQLLELKQLCIAQNLICEAYLGWFTQAEAYLFVPLCDRILLHAYVNKTQIENNPSVFYEYTKQRLSYIGKASLLPTAVSIIFSSESLYSGAWLTATSPNRQPEEAFTLFKNAYDTETASWKRKLNLMGYQWFTYSFMPVSDHFSAQSIAQTDNIPKNEENKTPLKIYPNPASDIINIENASQISIFNLFGQVVYTHSDFKGNTLNIQHLPNGTYILKTPYEAVRFIKN